MVILVSADSTESCYTELNECGGHMIKQLDNFEMKYDLLWSADQSYECKVRDIMR